MRHREQRRRGGGGSKKMSSCWLANAHHAVLWTFFGFGVNSRLFNRSNCVGLSASTALQDTQSAGISQGGSRRGGRSLSCRGDALRRPRATASMPEEGEAVPRPYSQAAG